MTNPKLLDVSMLQRMLESDNPPWLVDTRPLEDWQAGTLPGAISLNVYDYFIPQSDSAGILTMRRATRQAYKRLGIDQRPCVFFEQQTGMRSPRGLWFDEFIGRGNGAILDGGVDAWLSAGLSLAPGHAPANASTQASSRASGRAKAMTAAIGESAAEGEREEDSHHTHLVNEADNALVATIDEVLAADGIGTVVLDVRRRSEFNASFVHDCCARAGRIPHARFIFWEDVLRDGKYRDADALKHIAALAGLTPEQRILIYCHRGARAATVRYALLAAGFNNIAIFVGSWHEWAQRSDLPIHIGEPLA